MAENERAVVGGNQSSFLDAIQRFDLVGFMLARLETLACAVRDDRLDRACLKVLAALIDTMNRETRTSWAGRDRLGEICGISAKSAGNYIYQLKALGYVVSERRETPLANNRVLMHYTLAKLSPEEIETAIARAIGSIRGEISTVTSIESARQGGQSSAQVPVRTGSYGTASARLDGQSAVEVPVLTGNQNNVPVRTGKKVPAGTGNDVASARQDGQIRPESARQDGYSNSTTTNNTKTNTGTSGERGAGREPSHRGTRLPADWRLPKTWGDWAVAECVITPAQVRREADNFRDFWISKAGSAACKLDWQATWRNWIRRDYADRVAGAQTQHDAKPDAIDLILAAGRPKFGGGS